MIKLICFLFMTVSALAQVPQNFIAAGAGARQGTSRQTYGWISFGTKLSATTYSYSTTEYTQTTSSVRTGLAQILFQKAGLTGMTIIDAGLTTNPGASIAAQFSFGGILVYDLSPHKIPASIVFSFRPVKSNVAGDSTLNTAFQIGFAHSF